MLEPGTLLQNRYKVIEAIGKGGMGSVYRARDLRLRTDVALKETLFTDPAYRRAFQQEAQILARLRHQALPRVLDHFSEGQGQFLVMEYIPGEDLGNQLSRLGPRFATPRAMPTILRWADQLLDVLHYLHSRPIPVYHRDIKPKNLKLTPTYEIILLDFGLARGGVTVSFDLSETTAPAGEARKIYGFTPPYAPIEQMRDGEPDARSDLYALAATIYHFLTATMPVDAMSRMAKLINGQPDPLRPIRELAPHVPEGIADLFHRALSITVDGRPSSAKEMREELQRLRAALMTSRVTFSGATPSKPSSQPHAGDASDQTTPSEPRPPVEGLSTTAASYPGELTPNVARTPSEIQATPVGTLLRMLTTGSPIRSLDFSPSGALLAAGYDDHTAGLWRLRDFTHLATLKSHTSGIRCLRFASCGGTLATASDDETVRFWRVSDGAFLRLLRVPGCPIESIAYSPDGRHLAIGGWGSAITICRLEDDQIDVVSNLSAPFVHGLAFSPDGALLAAGAYDGSIYLWRVASWQMVGTLTGASTFINSVAFSPDGAWLVASSSSHVHVWRLSDRKRIETLAGHSGPVHALAFSPDGQLLATASEDRTTRLWRTSDWTLLPTTLEHRAGVASLGYSPQGSLIATGARDGRIYLWQIQNS